MFVSLCVCSCVVAVHTFPPLLPANVASRREGGGGGGGALVHPSCTHRYRPAWEQQRRALQSIFSSLFLHYPAPPFFFFLHAPFDSDRKPTCVAETKSRYRDKSIDQGAKAAADLYFYPDRLEKCQRGRKALGGLTARATGGGYEEEGFNKEERGQKNEGKWD